MSSPRSSLLCPQCRKLISSDEPSCPYCGMTAPGTSFRPRLTGELMEPEKLIKTIMAANVAMFLLSIFLSPSRHGAFFSPFALATPNSETLFNLGSTGSLPLFLGHRWWTLVSANYLHGGLLHIIFNMVALYQLGPLAIREYGVNRMFAIYTLGGVGGYLLSCFANIRFTIGASAAVCALLGALLYFGRSRGGNYGKAIYSQLAGWAMSIFFFGFLAEGINNWGHFGGMACGWLCGWLLGYEERVREKTGHAILARICLAVTVLALVWGVVGAGGAVLLRARH